MALKLSTTQAFAPAVSVGCSEEALIESIQDVSAAATALFECQADGAEILQVMDNLQLASDALENCGLTAELMSTFNSEGELSACCGLENLTVEGLEAMGVKQVEALEAKYAAGLEGKVGEYWNRFVQYLKKLWENIKHWFITLWQNRAKWFKTIEDIRNLKELDGAVKAAVVEYKTYDAFEKKMDAVEENLKKFKAEYTNGTNRTGAFGDASLDQWKKDLEDIFDKDKKDADKTLSSKGWDIAKLRNAYVKFNAMAGEKGTLADITKWINGAMDLLVKKAAKAGANESESDKEAVKKQHAALASALKVVRLENWICNKMFSMLYSVKKAAGKKAEKKETK